MRANEFVTENLRDWFKDKWVRFGPDGKIRGDCARGDDSEGKPKCLPQSKAHSLGKKGRASAASRKRREDPNPERSGRAINVNTKKKSNEGVAEGSEKQLTIQQLATISDEALDKAYGYGRSTPGNSFGWQANLMSAAYAKKMIDAGVTDIEKISDAIHKGWNVTAQKFVQDPDQFGDTEKLRQAGKLEAKLQQRAKLMKINYAQLDNNEQEKDRVVARALLQALTEQQGMAEEQLDELKCWDGYTRVQGVPAGAPGSCKKKTNEEQHSETCPHCGGEMVSEELINEKQDACYYKVKSRYKVWPSAYASGALVRCRKKGASNWGTGGKGK